MAEIDNSTLCMAIQAVDRELRRLDALSEPKDDEDILLADYLSAAMHLKAAWTAANERCTNLPPYESLVADND